MNQENQQNGSQAEQTDELTYGLLQEFENQPGCDRYSGDGAKIKLLVDYAWLRNLAPDLTFEEFLRRYQPYADFDSDNLKHPDDALKHFCPRAKTAADRLGKDQWTAKEVADVMVLYVDMCREADRTNVEAPTLNEFLQMVADDFKNGVQPPPEKPSRRATTKTKRAPTTAPTPANPDTGLTENNNPLRPSEEGQRVILERPSQKGRQVKGVITKITTEDDRTYGTFKSDDGEITENVNINHFTVCAEEPPAEPDSVERKRLWLPKAVYEKAQQGLQLSTAMANVPQDGVIQQWQQEFRNDLVAIIDLRNGETGPYIDPYMVNPQLSDEDDNIVAELPPRKDLIGDYHFNRDNGGVFTLEVRVRK